MGRVRGVASLVASGWKAAFSLGAYSGNEKRERSWASGCP